MQDTILRSYTASDENAFLEIQEETFKGIEYLPRVKTGLPALDREGSFVAERDGSIVAAIGLYKLEREGWFEIRNLALRDKNPEDLAKRLVSNVLEYVKSKHPRHLKASTPAVQPYVDLYKRAGFEPVRRIVRIIWDLGSIHAKPSKIHTQLLSKESSNDAANVWVEGLRPYWNYWIEEEGGPDELKRWVRESVEKTSNWIGAFLEDRLVGVAILRADSYGPGEARFNGAYALPEFRGQGVGSSLMQAVFREARRRNQRTMRVYTLAFLDHLAPGSILYLKSGGKIEAEYLQLERRVDNKSKAQRFFFL